MQRHIRWPAEAGGGVAMLLQRNFSELQYCRPITPENGVYGRGICCPYVEQLLWNAEEQPFVYQNAALPAFRSTVMAWSYVMFEDLRKSFEPGKRGEAYGMMRREAEGELARVLRV